MNKLPIEIQDKIFNLYWKDIFSNKVIKNINNINKDFRNIINFINYDYLSRNIEKKKLLPLMYKNNSILCNIINCKGLLLLLKKNNIYYYKLITMCYDNIFDIFINHFIHEKLIHIYAIAIYFCNYKKNFIFNEFQEKFKNYKEYDFSILLTESPS